MTGFCVYAQFNDSYAFRERPAIRDVAYDYRLYQTLTPDMSGALRSEVRRCAACGELLAKWDEPLTGLKIKKRRYDVSFTYDGVRVVSQRFKDVYDANGLHGLKFIPLPDDPEFYQILASEVVKFDSESSLARFGNLCPDCGQYESVVAPYKILKEGEHVPDMGFVRTDIEFASGDAKRPLLLCGPSAGRILKGAKLKGHDLEKF